MTLVGFHFKKMLTEKKKSISGKVNAKSNVAITKIQEAKLNMGSSKQAGAEFTFKFTIEYEPGIGNTELEGAFVYMADEKKVKAVIARWKKDQKLEADVIQEVYNHILNRCNIQALILAKDMQLPAHINLPRVNAESKK